MGDPYFSYSDTEPLDRLSFMPGEPVRAAPAGVALDPRNLEDYLETYHTFLVQAIDERWMGKFLKIVEADHRPFQ